MPVAIAAVAVGAAGAISAGKQAKAAKQAAAAQVAAADAATQLQREIYDDQRALMAPGALAGADAQARQMLMLGYSPGEVRAYLSSLRGALGGGNAQSQAAPNDDWIDTFDAQSYLRATPGYQWNFGEGQRALERSAAARGDLFSGATGRALTRYGQDYADGEWDEHFAQLGAIAGQGQNNTGTIVNVAGQYGDSAAANAIRAGDARASGYIGAGNAWGNFWGNTLPGVIGMGAGAIKQGGWGKPGGGW